MDPLGSENTHSDSIYVNPDMLLLILIREVKLARRVREKEKLKIFKC